MIKLLKGKKITNNKAFIRFNILMPSEKFPSESFKEPFLLWDISLKNIRRICSEQSLCL